MSIIPIIKPFVPGSNTVRPIPFKAHKIEEFSPEILEAHYEEVYGAAIRSLNKLELDKSHGDVVNTGRQSTRIQEDEEFRLANDILLHEVYFDSLGESGGQPVENSSLESVIRVCFSSMKVWRNEFLHLASQLGDNDGWIVLAWSNRPGRLLNLSLSDTSKGLFGVEPVLALDMCKHAYVDHFGDQPVAYSEAFLRNIDWERVGSRLNAVRSDAATPSDLQEEDQITVDQLQSLVDSDANTPLILDVRHDDDRERYRKRVLQSGWRDSFKVAEWADELPTDKLVVVYCMYGFWVSQKVAKELRSRGVDARSLSGGVTAWRAMGYSSSDNEF